MPGAVVGQGGVGQGSEWPDPSRPGYPPDQSVLAYHWLDVKDVGLEVWRWRGSSWTSNYSSASHTPAHVAAWARYVAPVPEPTAALSELDRLKAETVRLRAALAQIADPKVRESLKDYPWRDLAMVLQAIARVALAE